MERRGGAGGGGRRGGLVVADTRVGIGMGVWPASGCGGVPAADPAGAGVRRLRGSRGGQEPIPLCCPLEMRFFFITHSEAYSGHPVEVKANHPVCRWALGANPYFTKARQAEQVALLICCVTRDHRDGVLNALRVLIHFIAPSGDMPRVRSARPQAAWNGSAGTGLCLRHRSQGARYLEGEARFIQAAGLSEAAQLCHVRQGLVMGAFAP